MNEAKSTKYQRRRRKAEWWVWGACGAALALVALSPLATWLRDIAIVSTAGLPATIRLPLAHLGFTMAVAAIVGCSAFPALAYRRRKVLEPQGVVRKRAFREGWPTAVIVGAMTVPLGVLVRLTGAAAGSWWWLAASGLLSAGLVVAMRLGPAAFGRLASVRPLERPTLVSAVMELAVKAQVPVSGIYEWGGGESAGASALIAGIGRDRRVLVSSELLRTWSDVEVLVVVAHELGHHKHHDLLRATALNAAALTISLWCAATAVGLRVPAGTTIDVTDLALLPLIALVSGAVWLALTPLRHAQSRRHERKADAFALAHTGAADAFVAAIRRLGAARLSEEMPSRLTTWLYHGHPSVVERLAVAERYQEQKRERA